MKNESISKKISSQGESFFLQKPDGEENIKREQISFAAIRLSSLFLISSVLTNKKMFSNENKKSCCVSQRILNVLFFLPSRV